MSGPSASLAVARWNHPTYLVRRKIFAFLSPAFHVYDPAGNVVFYSKMKAFKLKEDIRVYGSEEMTEEVLTIRARRILDFSATYDVVDTASGTTVGALRRKGMASMLRDEWVFLGPGDVELGTIREDSILMAMLRRFLSNLIPQNFDGTIGGRKVCEFRQNFNPFVSKITLDFSPDTAGALDRRLGIAAAVLLLAVEGRQG